LAASAVLLVLLFAVFGRVLVHDRQFAFQDAGHYYYPLLERVQQEWDAGRWPLWAPEASAGTPLLGNPTAAVLYPGKLVFFVLPYPWAMRVFVIGHVAIAFGALWRMLRGWRVSATGSLLGALAYAFGVPVLSQTSNVIFLVGAAWAPLGFLAADRWARCGHRPAIAGLALVLALEVLGGDPEAAYVTVACAVGYAAGLAITREPRAARRRASWLGGGLVAAYLGLLGLSWWSARAIHVLSAAEPGQPLPWMPPADALVAAAWGAVAVVVVLRARGRASADASAGGDADARRFAAMLGGLLGASALGLAIAGAQLLPVLEYTSLSFRAARGEGLHDIYPYSAHPLQLLDAIWPNLYGTVEAGYRSWIDALPPKRDGRLWMPSLYLGGLTLVLAAAGGGFRARGLAPWQRWLSVVAVVCVLAALGYHASPLLWARCVPGWSSALGPLEPAFSWQVRTDGSLRDGDGGVYWFVASALPGFRSFRYPPKLLVVGALAVSALAGAGWDRLAASRSRRAAGVAAALLALSLAALASSWLGGSPLRAWFDRLAEALRTSDEPLDVVRAILDLRAALLHGTVAAAFASGLVVLAPRRPRLAGSIAVAGLALDLLLANAYHVVTVPQADFEQTPRALEVIRRAEREDPAPGPFRIERVGRWWPEAWSRSGAPRRFEEIVRWERKTLRSLYNMPLGIDSTFYLDTIEPLDYGLFFLPWAIEPDPAAVRTHGLKPGQKVWYYPRRGLDLWNTRYFLVPGRLVWDSPSRGYASVIPHSTFLDPAPGAFDGPDGPARRAAWLATDDFRVLRNEDAYPRAWIVHRAQLVPPIHGLRVADRTRLMQTLLYGDDEFWHAPGLPVRDPRSVALVETDRPGDVEPYLSRAAPDPSETATLTVNTPQRVELTAVLRSPGLVVVADMFYPGWHLSVADHPAPILRTNRAMRGVALPAGTHHLIFRYDPLSFRLGLGLSLVGLAVLAAVAAWALVGNWASRSIQTTGASTR
jgi:hypothetical protein